VTSAYAYAYTTPCAMAATTTVRVTAETRERLACLSAARGLSTPDLIAELAERAEENSLLELFRWQEPGRRQTYARRCGRHPRTDGRPVRRSARQWWSDAGTNSTTPRLSARRLRGAPRRLARVRANYPFGG
jgi:hypothetical protein